MPAGRSRQTPPPAASHGRHRFARLHTRAAAGQRQDRAIGPELPASGVGAGVVALLSIAMAIAARSSSERPCPQRPLTICLAYRRLSERPLMLESTMPLPASSRKAAENDSSPPLPGKAL